MSRSLLTNVDVIELLSNSCRAFGRELETDLVVTMDLPDVLRTLRGRQDFCGVLARLAAHALVRSDFTTLMLSALSSLWTALPMVSFTFLLSIGMVTTSALAVAFG